MTFVKNNLGLIVYLVVALIANIVLVPTGKEMMDFILGLILGNAIGLILVRYFDWW